MSVGPEIGQARSLKPYGVSWLQILAVLTGAMLVFSGITISQISGSASFLGGPGLAGLFVILGLGYGVLALSLEAPFVLATVFLITAFGLHRARRWAWYLSIMLSITSIGLNLAQIVFFSIMIRWFSSISLLVSVLILHYLTRPEVRSFFGTQTKSTAEPTTQQ